MKGPPMGGFVREEENSDLVRSLRISWRVNRATRIRHPFRSNADFGSDFCFDRRGRWIFVIEIAEFEVRGPAFQFEFVFGNEMSGEVPSYGLDSMSRVYPALTRWANECRAYGARENCASDTESHICRKRADVGHPGGADFVKGILRLRTRDRIARPSLRMTTLEQTADPRS